GGDGEVVMATRLRQPEWEKARGHDWASGLGRSEDEEPF
ncbi:hypothetical protein Tco_1542684, partial [Tanacetum coccineum]